MKTLIIIIFSFLISFTKTGFLSHLYANQSTGTIQGKVFLNTIPPALPQIIADKSVDFCGATLPDPILLVQDGGVKWAIVSLEWQSKVQTKSESPIHISLKSQNCQFHPRIQATHLGAYLHLNSGDEIAHNPHGWWNDTKTVFNITLLDPSLKFKRKLRWAGTYRVECDTHTWMKSYILVFDHPYFTVTDEKGQFVLKNVPVGKHTIRVWHEVLGEHTTEVVVTPKDKTEQNFSLSLVDHRHETLKPKTVSPWPPNGKHQ